MRRGFSAFLLLAAATICAPLYATVTLTSLTPSVAAPQPLGTTVTWTVTATDSNPNPLTFQLNVTSPTGVVSMVYDFNIGTSNAGVWSFSFPWATIAGEGVYQVQVVAKDFTSGETQSQSANYQLVSLVSSGNATVSATANPLVALYSAPSCALGSLARVIFQASGATGWSATDWKACTGNTSMNFYVAGMYPSSTYNMDYQVQTGSTITPGPSLASFTTGALPTNVTFPKFTATVPGPQGSIDSQQPLIIQSLGSASTGDINVATDLAGRIVWYYNPIGVALLTRPLADETMLDIQSGAAWTTYTNVQQLLRQFDLAGNVVHQTNTGVIQQELVALGSVDGGSCDAVPNPAPIGSACISFFNHEFTQLPNGNFAAIATIEKIFPAGTQGSTSPLPIDIQGDMIIVMNSNLQVIWYWDSFDPDGGGYGYPLLPVSRVAILGETCVSLADLCGPIFLTNRGTANAGNQWLHGNSVFFMPSSGDLLFSMRSQDWVVKIDYNNGAGTGNILWALGNGGSFTFNNVNNDPWPWFSGQHDPTYANNGAGPLTVYDDGNTRRAAAPQGLGAPPACNPYCSSRGMAFTVDETNMVVTPVLSQYLAQNSRAYGSSQLLTNGNYFFNNGIVNGTYGIDTEVLPTSGSVSGTNIYTIQTQPLYRSYRVSTLYQSLMDQPATLTKTAGDVQSTTADQAFATPLQVTVTDPNGVALVGVPVTFTVLPGAGGASGTFGATPPITVPTNASGIAIAPTLTANAIGGSFTVMASAKTLSATFTLTNLVYSSLGASSATVGNTAGSGSVVLVAAGAWTAVSNASWLQIAPGSASGIGNALIQFNYAANSNAAAQTGTLTIAGWTFTVTQAGTSYLPISLQTALVSSGLSNPQGVALDTLGNVYIADTGDNAIKEFSAGAQLTVLSSAQSSPGAVAVDGHGNVYIADSGNHAIEEFGFASQQLTTLVSGLSNPSGVAVDSQGDVYFSDTSNNVIEEWVAATQQVMAGSGTGLNNPTGVALDAQGNVYFADSGNNAIKEWIAPSGPATVLLSMGLSNPTGVAVDGQGNVYLADTGNNAIKQWNAATQQVTALATIGLSGPMGVAVDAQGNVYIADTGNSAIQKFTPAYLALSSTSVMEGAQGGTDSVTAQVLPASIPLTAVSDQPWLTITGIAGGVISFSFPPNTTGANLVAHITVLGQQITVTQSGDVPAFLTKTAGDGQTTTASQAFATPLQVTVTDSNSIPLPGIPVTFTVMPGAGGAGGTFASTPPMPILTNASGIATAPTLTANTFGGTFTVTASFNALSATFTLTNMVYGSLAASSATVGNAAGSGSVFLLATGSWTALSNASWLQIAPGSAGGTGNALIQFSYSANSNAAAQTGTLTIAGLTFTVTQLGTSYVSVPQLATLVSTGLNNPQGVAVDGSGNVYIGDTLDNAVKEWNAGTQQVSTLVGSGLNYPAGVAVDSQGNVYFADEKNNAIKEWSVATGTVTPLVATGLSSPVGVALDAQGNVYFSDAGHSAIKKWSVGTQQVSTLVSTGLNIPLGVAVDAFGNVYFADEKNNAIKEWSVTTTLVSTLVSGLNLPYGVAVDGDGNVYFADTGNNAVKEWSPASQQVTVLVSSGVRSPCQIAVDGQGNIYIADLGDKAIKKYTAVYLSLGATSRNEGAVAGTDSISYQVVPASTILTAASNQSWLTITGTTGGAIGFSFTANTSVSSRSATITVLGQTITVTQSADVPTTISKIAGLGQHTPVNQPFAVGIEVRVTDAAGKGVQGVSVTFVVDPAANGAAGTFASSPPMPILTNSSGYATAPVLTANSITGTFGVTASAGTLSTLIGATITSN